MKCFSLKNNSNVSAIVDLLVPELLLWAYEQEIVSDIMSLILI